MTVVTRPLASSDRDPRDTTRDMRAALAALALSIAAACMIGLVLADRLAVPVL
jgi:hypothetical protein